MRAELVSENYISKKKKYIKCKALVYKKKKKKYKSRLRGTFATTSNDVGNIVHILCMKVVGRCQNRSKDMVAFALLSNRQ